MTPQEQEKALTHIKQAIHQRQLVRVLLVEDVEADAPLSMPPLSEIGLHVKWVKTLQHAEACLQVESFWLVFLDLRFPGQRSGLQLVRWIQKYQPDPHSRVIVLTDVYQHDSEECKEALRLGAVAVMMKPLTREKVDLLFRTP